MRLLVTGAAGFIGSHAVRAALGRSWEVHAAVRSGCDRRRLADVEQRLVLHEADMHDTAGMAALVAGVGPDAVLHLAWYADPRRYLHSTAENLQCLESSAALARALLDAGGAHLVVAGTSLEPAAGTRGTRQAARRPASVYAACKAAMHGVVEGLAAEGLAAACAHVFYLYGPWEHEHRLVPYLVRSLLAGERVAVTDGRQRRDYLHVTDVADGLCAVVEHRLSGSVDVCSGTARPLADVFGVVGAATGAGHLIDLGARRYGPDEVLLAEGDATALAATGWRPSLSLHDGMEQTVAWWKHHLGSAIGAGRLTP